MPDNDPSTRHNRNVELWCEIHTWLACRLRSEQLFQFESLFIDKFLDGADDWLSLPKLVSASRDVIAVADDKRLVTASLNQVMNVFTLASFRLSEIAPDDIYTEYREVLDREFEKLVEREARKQSKAVSLIPSFAVNEVEGE